LSNSTDNASSSSEKTGEDDAFKSDNQDDIPGYSADSGDATRDAARPVAPINDAGFPISDLERQEFLKENQSIRKIRWIFFIAFGAISFALFSALPFEANHYINKTLKTIAENNTRSSLYAIVSANVIFAVVGAVPLTIFITLSQIFKKGSTSKNDEKTSSINDKKSDNIAQSITTLISTLAVIVKGVKEAWKKGMK